MSVSQTLSVTEVAGSVNNTANTSKVRILWQSTQSGDSWNGYTRTAKYYVSINGGAETTYSVSYTLPQNSTKTIVDTTITVTHNDNGTGSVKVRTWMDTGISVGVVEKTQSLTLTTIPMASTITSAIDRTLGSSCSVKWTPLSKSFRYKLNFSIGDLSYTTGAIHPNTTSAYTYTGYALPISDIAPKITGAPPTGTMTVTLYTYSDSNATVQIGASHTKTFKVTVPDNASTKPTVTMTPSPVSALGSAFSGLYIQGKSRVKVSFSGSGKYGATIASYGLTVLGKGYASPFQTEHLSTSGTVAINGRAKDSRGFVTEISQDITVIPYSKPKLTHASGSNAIVCARCDASGNLTDSGTYLKIKVGRDYSRVWSGGIQKNFCLVRYRYKTESASNYSSYITLLAKDNMSTDSVDVTLGNIVSSTTTSYIVELSAVDDIGDSTTVTFTIPTDEVDFHLKDGGGGAAFGKYSEEEDLLDVAWNARVRKELRLGSNGDALYDFVIEQGTSGIWSYRKWYSGLAECWGRYSGTPTNLGGKRNEVEVSLPFVFSGDVYHVQLTGGQNCYAPYTTDFADCNAKGTVVHANSGFYFSYLYGGETAYSYSVNINVTGWWK